MKTLVGKIAPHFEADAVFGNTFRKISLKDYAGKYLCLFFYPLDFTFVCPTELHAFSDRLGEFQKRKCEVLACSTDSKFSHQAWLSTPRSRGGIEGINYPILSDQNKNIARDYGVLFEEEGISYRGLFIIDEKQIVQHVLINNLPIGRSVDEALRIVDAIQYHSLVGEVCPANWKQGEKGMRTNSESLREFFADNS
jgi:peroxiredoxin (alkyl hydroperoxide reductase subunit C)